MKRTRLLQVLTLLLVIIMAVGCGKSNNEKFRTSDLEKNQYRIYYINNNETGFTPTVYTSEETDVKTLINQLMNELTKEPNKYSGKKVLNEDVIVKDYSLDEDVLTMNFEPSYDKLSPVSEVLTRAAIVKTLCQIAGVDYILFCVNGQPLIDQYDKPVGNMTAEDFIDGTEVDSNLIPVTLTLYFANESGNALVAVTRPVTYDGTITQEQLVLQQLISGPEAGEGDVLATVPRGTVVNSVTTKDGICYVDFNKNFLDKNSEVKDEVAIYSVVNSLVELANINKVQFSIDGKTRDTYRETIEFDILFERNLQLVEGSN